MCFLYNIWTRTLTTSLTDRCVASRLCRAYKFVYGANTKVISNVIHKNKKRKQKLFALTATSKYLYHQLFWKHKFQISLCKAGSCLVQIQDVRIIVGENFAHTYCQAVHFLPLGRLFPLWWTVYSYACLRRSKCLYGLWGKLPSISRLAAFVSFLA